MRVRRVRFHAFPRRLAEDWALALWLRKQNGADAVFLRADRDSVEFRYMGDA